MLRLALFVALVAGSVQAQSAGVSIQQAADAVGVTEGVLSGLTPAEALAATVLPGATSANVVILLQQGDFNSARIEQGGVGNRFSLVQRGNGNAISAQILGSYNTTNVTQNGTTNSYDLLLAADDVQLLPVVQEGDGNQAFQFVQPGLQPAGIEQRGSGMEVTVERVLR